MNTKTVVTIAGLFAIGAGIYLWWNMKGNKKAEEIKDKNMAPAATTQTAAPSDTGPMASPPAPPVGSGAAPIPAITLTTSDIVNPLPE
jgi:hypothetical protein